MVSQLSSVMADLLVMMSDVMRVSCDRVGEINLTDLRVSWTG